MLTILSLFARSPFAPLESHIEIVSQCVHNYPKLFDAISKRDLNLANQIAEEIYSLEHHADMIKNDIRNHLPKTLILPIARHQILEILHVQDRIADHAQDGAIMAMLKPLQFFPSFEEQFLKFLAMNIETFDTAKKIIKEIHELVESSFGGIEAERVRRMVDYVAHQEHEVDLIQRNLLKTLFQAESEMSYGTFYQWQRVIESVSSFSNLSENLAYRVRMTLELK